MVIMLAILMLNGMRSTDAGRLSTYSLIIREYPVRGSNAQLGAYIAVHLYSAIMERIC